MAAKIDIVNSALVLLGQDVLTSLSADNRKARICAQRIDKAIRAVLRAYPWNCAIKRGSLAALSSTPAYGYTYEYQLPTDCLRVLEIQDDPEFKIEGRKILTDASAPLRYAYLCEADPSEFDSLVEEAVAARLAADIAYPLANDKTLGQAMYALYKDKLLEAQSIDAQEGTAPTYEYEGWIEARL